jgi:3-deoxy-manno-octulosonate cytidylyltransferase (CMP-KDO synthetase)
MRIVAVLPARMASSRFPNKPLAKIAGLEMIEHVRRRTLMSPSVDEVVVATCDQIIKDTVESFGGKAVYDIGYSSRMY